jgi:AAA family ATP:ADP antiporter
MRSARRFWRSLVDVREGERLRTLFTLLYLFSTLTAYYIIKPLSKGMFMSKFKVDELPHLNMALAITGGVFAYLYTKLAVKSSLRSAVIWTSGISVFCLASLWWALGTKRDWMLYVFNIWVSMFSIVMVTQCWVVAANFFTSREAKRVYTLLGTGAVLGGAFGGFFTNAVIPHVSAARHMLWFTCVWIGIAYLMFRLALAQSPDSLQGATAGDKEEAEFRFKDIVSPLLAHRHLQLIMGITLLMLCADVMIEFQMNSMIMRKTTNEKDVVQYLAKFTALYPNLLSVFLQFVVAGLAVRSLGVSGTLQIMPVCLGAVSAYTIAAPSLVITTIARNVETSSRYTLNRTAMELLYMPLPLELRNRTKAFIDIFVDRFGRGLGGFLQKVMLYLPITRTGKNVNVQPFAVVTFCMVGLWSLLAWRARGEYLATVLKRIQSRRLDLETVPLQVQDPALIALLEKTARGPNPRQSTYALSLLAEIPDYRGTPLLKKLVGSPHPSVRAKVYEIARAANVPELLDQALEETRSSRAGEAPEAASSAAAYAIAVSPDGLDLAASLLDHPHDAIGRAAIDALAADPDRARRALTAEWLAAASTNPLPERRRLAAHAILARAEDVRQTLRALLRDNDPQVAIEACRTAQALQDRQYVEPLTGRLGDRMVRPAAIAALAGYGARVVGTLADLLGDGSVPVSWRGQIPRVLRLIPDQRSVDVLVRHLTGEEPVVRQAVLRALNYLRERAPGLDYAGAAVAGLIRDEVRSAAELAACVAPFDGRGDSGKMGTMLAATLHSRREEALERIFRLLGLRYSQPEIHRVYRALQRKLGDDRAAALDYLDSVLDREDKRAVMALLERDQASAPAKDAESAIVHILGLGDPWLKSCAIAAAAELRLVSVEPHIRRVAEGSDADSAGVARWALRAMRG